jgi:hypothetical protein
MTNKKIEILNILKSFNILENTVNNRTLTPDKKIYRIDTTKFLKMYEKNNIFPSSSTTSENYESRKQLRMNSFLNIIHLINSENITLVDIISHILLSFSNCNDIHIMLNNNNIILCIHYYDTLYINLTDPKDYMLLDCDRDRTLIGVYYDIDHNIKTLYDKNIYDTKFYYIPYIDGIDTKKLFKENPYTFLLYILYIINKCLLYFSVSKIFNYYHEPSNLVFDITKYTRENILLEEKTLQETMYKYFKTNAISNWDEISKINIINI